MPERPIVMSAESVRALLEGRKTQARRVVAPRLHRGQWWPSDWQLNQIITINGRTEAVFHESDYRNSISDYAKVSVKCPYPVGTRLWVKETWQYAGWSEDGEPQVRYKADGALAFPDVPNDDAVMYKLHDLWAELSRADNYDIDGTASDRKWRSPLFMPRWASRILLTVKEVRVQRLQDISIGDALAEGIRCPDCGYTSLDAGFHMDHGICVNKWLRESKVKDVGDHAAVQAFREHWDSINAKRGHPWSQNDWVWAFTFRRTDA